MLILVIRNLYLKFYSIVFTVYQIDCEHYEKKIAQLNNKIINLLKRNEKIPLIEQESYLIKMNDHKLQSKILNIQSESKIALVNLNIMYKL